MKKIVLTLNLCLCFYLFALAQQTRNQDYKYTVHFESNQDQLTSHAKSKLEKRLADYISKDIQSIQIVGHADVRGHSDYNIALSQRRTQSVQDFLNQNGFNRFPISNHYKGENEPHIIDDSKEGLQANRRVEIWFVIREVIPEKPVYTTAFNCTGDREIIPEPVTKTLSSYQQFHQQLDKNNLNFYLDNKSGGLLKAKEGTVIYFYPNSFCDCNTQENIEGKINIQLKEYYQISDFIQAGLSTNANDEMLQSAGTIHIDAFQNKQKICLKNNQKYQILFPKNKMNKEDYSDMNLFVGNMNDRGEVNWGVLAKDGLENKEAMDFIIENGNNCSKCGGFEGYRGKLRFVERLGDFFVSHAFWKFYKFKRSPEGKAAVRQNNQRVRIARKICENKKDSLVSQLRIPFDELAKELEKTGKGWEEYLFNYYITSSSKLNYINCDRFTDYSRNELANINIPIHSKEDLAVKIIIESANGILSGKPSKRKYAFGKLPKGKKAKLLAYDYSGEKPKIAQLSFKIGEKVEMEDLVFKEYSMDDFKKQLSNLN